MQQFPERINDAHKGSVYTGQKNIIYIPFYVFKILRILPTDSNFKLVTFKIKCLFDVILVDNYINVIDTFDSFILNISFIQ